MGRFFGEEIDGQIQIVGEEFNHLKNVLRLGIGEQIIVYLNNEYEYACEIEKIVKKSAICKVIGQKVCEGNPKKNIVLFQALPKREKFEFIIQKATEIGITKVVPFMSEHCIAKISESKSTRFKSIVQNACKQCERSIETIVDEVIDVDKVIEQFKKAPPNTKFVIYSDYDWGQVPRNISKFVEDNFRLYQVLGDFKIYVK